MQMVLTRNGLQDVLADSRQGLEEGAPLERARQRRKILIDHYGEPSNEAVRAEGVPPAFPAGMEASSRSSGHVRGRIRERNASKAVRVRGHAGTGNGSSDEIGIIATQIKNLTVSTAAGDIAASALEKGSSDAAEEELAPGILISEEMGMTASKSLALTALGRISQAWHAKGSSDSVETGLTAGSHSGTLERTKVVRRKAGYFKWFEWVSLVLIIVFSLLLLVAVFHARILGKALAVGIETYDRDILGVDVEITSLKATACTGQILVEGVRILNPPGYKSPYLMQARSIIIDLSMRQLALSLGKLVVVDRLQINHVDVTIEKSWTSSNVQDVESFLMTPLPVADPPPAQQSADAGACPGTDVASPTARSWWRRCAPCSRRAETAVTPPTSTDSASSVAPSSDEFPTVVLHKVLIHDIRVQLLAKMVCGASVKMNLADISYEDFDADVGAYIVDDIVRILLKTLLKNVSPKVTGRRSN